MKACPKCGKRFLGGEEFCPTDGATLQVLDEGNSDDPLVGTTVDNRYHVDKKIGEGGMGMVYLATHAVIGKKCALKVLRSDMTGEAEIAQRFLQEAQSAAAIGNEHIIEINDFGQLDDGSAYFVMEFLDGIALTDFIEENPIVDPIRILNIVVQCCDALAAAHNSNIVHRDLKPDNIFLLQRGGTDDFVKILDFGIAKVARENSRLTKTGMVFGTPQYMSPEQAAGTGVDHRTDIYSLGIIMYEMLCGRVPFEADTFMGVLTKHLYEEPIPPRRLVPPVDILQNVEAVLLKSIAKKPEKRYSNMLDFAEDLKSLIENKTPRIVFEQMSDTSFPTVPPPSPASVVGADSPETSYDSDEFIKPKAKWPIFAGIGALAACGVVGAVFMLGGNSNGHDEKKQVGQLQAQSSANIIKPAVQPVVPNSQVPQNVKKPEATTPEVQKKNTVEKTKKLSSVMLSSVPTGATLYKKNAFMGLLPFKLLRPKKGEPNLQYTVKMDGYEELEIVVTESTPAEFKINLKKQKKKARRKKSERQTIIVTPPPASKEAKPPKKKKRKKKSLSDLADPWG